MTEQRDYRMPQTGDAWRHYKGGLYTVVGLARDENGGVVVVYTENRWSSVQLPPLYVQPLGRFLQEVENGAPRFWFMRERDEVDAPFVNPKWVGYRIPAVRVPKRDTDLLKKKVAEAIDSVKLFSRVDEEGLVEVCRHGGAGEPEIVVLKRHPPGTDEKSALQELVNERRAIAAINAVWILEENRK